MKKSLLVLIALCAGFGPVFPVMADNAHPTRPEIKYLPRETVTVETQAGQDYIFEVEMATNGEDQSRGLMYRTTLGSDAGMLFLFGDEEHRSFWMKDTFVPLDMIFIASDGTIRHIHHSARPQDETRITSEGEAMAVLEINAGLSGSLGIKEGDRVIHPAFRNVLAP
ncbi:MAG: DUF192 domain-containing protein [Alphaproteobacteria bacterium]